MIIIKERYKSYDIKIKECITNTEGVLNDNLENNINVVMIENFKIKIMMIIIIFLCATLIIFKYLF